MADNGITLLSVLQHLSSLLLLQEVDGTRSSNTMMLAFDSQIQLASWQKWKLLDPRKPTHHVYQWCKPESHLHEYVLAVEFSMWVAAGAQGAIALRLNTIHLKQG